MEPEKVAIFATLDMLYKADREKLLDTLLGFALMVGSRYEGRNPSLEEWWGVLQMVDAAYDMAPPYSTCTPDQVLAAMELAPIREQN